MTRGRFLINKCENNYKYIDKYYSGPKRSFSNQQVWINSKYIDNNIQVPRGRFLINKCESTLDALIDRNQVPRGRFLINKCENNYKYMDKYYSSHERSFSNQQVWKQL